MSTIWPDPKPGLTHKAAWLEALARYPKTRSVLCQTNHDDPLYCCLGVLAKEDGVLRLDFDGHSIRFYAPITDEEDEVVGHRWVDPSESSEEYVGHPHLSFQSQSILIRANDITDTFDELVIPLIELLFNDDLSLLELHEPLSTEVMGSFQNFFAATSETDARSRFHRILTALQSGVSFSAAVTTARNQVEKEGGGLDG